MLAGVSMSVVGSEERVVTNGVIEGVAHVAVCGEAARGTAEATVDGGLACALAGWRRCGGVEWVGAAELGPGGVLANPLELVQDGFKGDIAAEAVATKGVDVETEANVVVGRRRRDGFFESEAVVGEESAEA